jgi:hypothetical protein
LAGIFSTQDVLFTVRLPSPGIYTLLLSTTVKVSDTFHALPREPYNVGVDTLAVCGVTVGASAVTGLENVPAPAPMYRKCCRATPAPVNPNRTAIRSTGVVNMVIKDAVSSKTLPASPTPAGVPTKRTRPLVPASIVNSVVASTCTLEKPPISIYSRLVAEIPSLSMLPTMKLFSMTRVRVLVM